MRRTSIVLRLVLGGAVASVLLTGCGGDGAGLAATIEADQPTDQLLLSDAYPDADSVVVVCPYATAAEVDATLGLDFKTPGDAIPADEGRQTMVVVIGDEVSTTEELDRTPVDLCGDPDVVYPVSLAPATPLTLTEEKDADGKVLWVADVG